ncbi:MAG: M50 family metallopeptidase [Propionibacteriaceae bacterium]
MELLTEIWRRAVSQQPDPPAAVVALMAALAVVLVVTPTLWPLTRLAVTITHEGAHAFVAVLAGRRLQGIRLHSDTSGVTVSRGRASGPGMVAMLAAGYLGPAVVGVGAALMLGAGFSLGLLWCYVLLLALMLLQIRNFYGFAVVVGAGVAMAAISWFLSAPAQSAIAYLITWVLLVAAPKPVVELARQRRRGHAGHSDADQLARLTRVPGTLWTVLFLLANLVGLVVGAVLLAPALRTVTEDLIGRLGT